MQPTNKNVLTVLEIGLKLFKGVRGGTWHIRRTGPVEQTQGTREGPPEGLTQQESRNRRIVAMGKS